MPAETCFIGCDFSTIEDRVIVMMNSDFATARQWRLDQKEKCLDALMTPTGRTRRGRVR